MYSCKSSSLTGCEPARQTRNAGNGESLCFSLGKVMYVAYRNIRCSKAANTIGR